jgi:ATP-dependent protease HslVU (ClpYQ) peptidase subunit
MTTVVAIQEKGNVVFASDSQTSWGNRKSFSAEKVFTNSGIMFGACGDVRVSNVFKAATLPTPEASLRKRGDIFRWLVNELIPALQKALEDAGTLTARDGETSNRGSFLVAVNHQCFELSGDFAVTSETSGRYAVGSGSDFALGALAAGATPQEAVKIATQLDAYTGGKVRVVNSAGGVR